MSRVTKTHIKDPAYAFTTLCGNDIPLGTKAITKGKFNANPARANVCGNCKRSKQVR